MFTRTLRGKARARRGAPFVASIAILTAVAVLSPPAVTAEVLGGAPDRTAAPPPQDGPEVNKPSTFEGLQYGDPASGIDLIEPPETDAYGGAQLRHPIELPQGRLNWQPQIALAYDSGGGNGWMGQGWDLSLDAIRVPGLGADVSADSISVDTRFGVPRYLDDKESETYVFGAEQLSPTAHRSPQLDRVAERQFTKRVEGDYLRIIRHGDNPKNYWWEVHDKLGNKYFYGGEVAEYRTSDDTLDPAPVNRGRLVPEATLSTERGIYWWGLREKFDISTNSVTYFYDKKQTDLPGIGKGTELYLSRINYSGSKLRADQTYDGTPSLPALPRYGRYDLSLVRETGRPDVMSDATGGALHTTSERLKRIDITFCPQARRSIGPGFRPTQEALLACPVETQLVRQYKFDYESGPFEKSLLKSVGKADNGSNVFATHTFDYFDEVTSGDGYDGFGGETSWDFNGESTGVGEAPLGTLSNSVLGSSHSLGGDGRLFLGFSLLPIKILAAGGGIQMGGSNGKTDIEFLDINGDSLPDKVWIDRGDVHYQLNRSGPHGTDSFGPKPPEPVAGLSSLGESSDFFVGAGAEAYVAIIALMYNKTWTFSKETTYFNDVNADGRPDLVDGGKVLFNVLGPDGRISFSDQSADTGVKLGTSAALDPAVLLPDQSGRAAEQTGQFPKVDTLRRWVAPWTGAVEILAPVSLTGASVDGARVTIEKFGPGITLGGIVTPDPGTVLFAADLEPGSTGQKWPGGQANVPIAVPVLKGDHVYFRVQSRDNGAGDEVSWDPVIRYGSPSRLDVNGKDVYRYAASEDFTLAGRPGSLVGMPFDGRVRIQGDVNKVRRTSDDLTVLVTRSRAFRDANGKLQPGPEVPILTQTIPGSTIGSTPVDITVDVTGTHKGANPPATVLPGDQISTRIALDTEIDPTGITWTPTLTYLEARNEQGQPVRTTDETGAPMMTIHPPASVEIYPLNNLVAPQDTVDLDAGEDMLFYAHASTLNADALPARVVASIKNRDGLVIKKELTVTQTQVQVDVPIAFKVPTSGEYWFDLTYKSAVTPGMVRAWIDRSPDGRTNSVPVPETGYHWTASSVNPDKPDLFPAPYRGWAYAGYNGEGARATTNINEKDLLFNRDDYPGEDDKPTKWGDENYKNPIHNKAYAFAPDTKSGTWLGPKQPNSLAKGAIFGGPARSSSSRIGPDTSTITVRPGDAVPSGARGPVITGVGDVDAFGLGVSVVGVGIGTGAGAGKTTGQVDFLDLNGDAFPDVVGENVYYTNEVGGLTPSQTWNGDVRYDHEFSQSYGSEGSPASVPTSASGDTNSDQQAGNPSSASDRAGKGAKGAKAPGASDGGGDGGGGGGSGGGGGGQKAKKKAPNGGGDGGEGGGDGDSKADVGADLGVSGELTNTWTNSQEIQHTGLQQLVSGDAVEEDLADINGDGLRDRVTVDTDGEMEVALNLGYSFAPYVAWPSAGALEQGTSTGLALGLSFGFNVDKFGFSGGLNYSSDTGTTDHTWDDVNGDGLPDQLYESGGQLYVAFNTGKGLAAPKRWGPLQEGEISKSESVGVGGGADFTVTVGPLCWPTFLCYIDINPGFHIDGGFSATRASLADVDGDGLIDTVSSDSSDSLFVRRNKTGRTNMLKTVHRPMGASFSLQYDREGNTTEHPDSMWVLTKVTTHDGHSGDGVDTQVTTYRYEEPRFDFAEREDYGFRKVTQTELDTATNQPYRVYEQVYRNRSYYERGILESETLRDAAGKVLTSTLNTHEFVDSSNPLAPVVLTGHGSLTGSVFPRLVKTEDRWHGAGDAVVKSTEMNYEYDARGNLLRMTDRGEPALPGDDIVSEMRFTQCDGPGGDPEFPWTQMPDIMIVRSGTTVLQRREAQVDCNTASVAEVRDYLTPTGDDPAQVAVTTVLYLPVGGQTSAIIGPGPRQTPDPNEDVVQLNLDTRYGVEYAWDEVGAIPLRTSDSYGLVTTATWDDRMGRLLSKTDPNHGNTSYAYDSRGRLTSVTGPMEQGGPRPTIAYEYGAEATVPWVAARHVDPANANATFTTVQFVDGLGREIQDQAQGAVGGAPKTIVSGAVDYDSFGRVVAEYYPTTVDISIPVGQFHAPRDGVVPTRTAYTVRDRLESVTEPGDRVTTYDYGFAQGPFSSPMFTVLETDPAQKKVRQYSDVRENIVGVEDLHKPAGSNAQKNLLTRYDYDPLARLVTVVDPAGKTTRVGYDQLGRRTSVDNPDTGKTEFRYDLQDNVVAEITANLRGAGKQVTNEYERTRLKAVRYPDNPANNVTYAYGAPVGPNAPEAAANAAGRITRIEDGSRTLTRAYDVLGEVVTETATMKVHNLSPQTAADHTYTSRYRYDTWGRLLSMVYPDGEVLTYNYDAGGLPRSATGVKDGVTYPYADRVEYDKFGNRTLLSYGNGVLTQTSYDPETVWFADQVVTVGPTKLSELHYRYDKAGNVLQRNDTRPLPPASEMGGPSTQTFGYDDLHRLVSGSGTYTTPPNKKRDYSLSQRFDDAGRISKKDQQDKVNGKEEKDTTYDLEYEYGGAASHAPSKIGDRKYQFDANGNVTKWIVDKNGTNRTVLWDEENRMTRATDQSSATDYRYTDDDDLGVLRGPQGEIEFVTDTYVHHNGAGAWKTVLIDDLPVATKRVDNAPELKQYYMTADLLDSVNLVTDDKGKLFEHTLYLPSGEMWFWEKSTVYREPYLFAGSYYDEFRKLNQLEARWYEPHDGIMYSPDPILVDDLESAVLEPRLFSAYTYGFDNPELYVDDTGRQSVNNQQARRPHFGSTKGKKLLYLKATKRQIESEGRIGRFNARIEKLQESRGYEMADSILGGSMVEIEITYDGSLSINPKVMGIGLDDFRGKKKKKMAAP